MNSPNSVRNRLEKERGRPLLKDRAPVQIALAYPNHYDVGMASLGFQTVFRLFNEQPHVRCERVFLNEKDRSGPLRTFESGENLRQFDLIGFSVSFELDIPNVVRMLIQSGIPPLSRERNQAHPLVFLGGAIGGLNPSPLLPFVDGLLAGEGEGIITRISDILYEYRQGRNRRDQRLEALSEIEGIFIPFQNITVRRHLAVRLSPPPAYTPIITPLSHFANLFVIETGRGCPQGCLFCAACKLSHPFRIYSLEAILDAIRMFNPGADKIGLEGAGLSDYPHLIALCKAILGMNLSISFSSIRADRISEDLVSVIESSKVRSFTIAPEAGAETMRKRIGKEMDESVLKEKVDLLSNSKINVLKLYYLIGLPGETDQDIEALIESVKMISDRFLIQSKTRRVRLSVNGFIPKPFTEFQWASMQPETELIRKRRRITERLKKNKQIFQVPKSGREEILQGIFSLGDSKVGMAVIHALQNRKGLQRTIADSGVNMDRLLFLEKKPEDPMPWDFIRYDVSKERLWNRYQRGKYGKDRTGNRRV